MFMLFNKMYSRSFVGSIGCTIVVSLCKLQDFYKNNGNLSQCKLLYAFLIGMGLFCIVLERYDVIAFF